VDGSAWPGQSSCGRCGQRGATLVMMGQSCLLEALGGRIPAQESASCLIFFEIPNFEQDFSMQHFPPWHQQPPLDDVDGSSSCIGCSCMM